jgi:hypothetical protein
VYRFVSPHVPTQGPADCESFLETDHFRRNKALLADGKGIWAAWQKSKAVGAELIYADEDGAETWPLGVCRGVRGQDVWPHFSLADTDAGKRIVYYAGNAYRRDYIDKEPPYRPIKCFSGPVREQYARVVLEDGELDPPGCPAQLAVFDVSNRQVTWTYDISPNYPSLPPNLDQHYIDRSQMVVAGKWAYIGWLDLDGDDAKLRLLGFDVTTAKPEPVENVFSLGFAAKNFPNSVLTDLIAVDGQLYALVTQAATMAPNRRVFDAQQVFALANR